MILIELIHMIKTFKIYMMKCLYGIVVFFSFLFIWYWEGLLMKKYDVLYGKSYLLAISVGQMPIVADFFSFIVVLIGVREYNYIYE